MYYDLLYMIENDDDLIKTVCDDCKDRVGLSVSVYSGVFKALSKLMDFRDPYTRGHEIRVAKLAVEIGKRLGLEKEELVGLLIAAELHDVGKIGVPIEFLAKPGRITKEEFAIIKHHSEIGYEIIREINFPWDVAETVLQHHERIDGSGYPHGLKGDEILLNAKIVCVADVAEAMISHRPYRPGLGVDVAMEEITAGRGTRYDAAVADCCLALFKQNPHFLDL